MSKFKKTAKLMLVCLITILIILMYTAPLLRAIIQRPFDFNDRGTYHDSQNCFPPSVWNVFRIDSNMNMEDVVRIMGKPQYSGPQSIVSENWITAEGMRVFIQWSNPDTLGRIVIYKDQTDNSKYLILTPNFRRCYSIFVLSIGLATGATVIIFATNNVRRKKKKATE